jgi:hypothetical protein
MSEFVLLGSVFLPGTTFGPLADALAERGHRVRVASAERASTADDVLAAYLAALDQSHAGVIAVAHSNAGAYVPALAARASLGAVVFMDAVLPEADGAMQPAVRADLAERMRPLVVDGRLPRWTDWWPMEDVVALFPDEQTFAEVHAATPRVPAEYLDTAVEVPEGWTVGLNGAFLAFGGTYAEERGRAESLGWRTRTMPLAHLGHLQQPEDVARELLHLVAD